MIGAREKQRRNVGLVQMLKSRGVETVPPVIRLAREGHGGSRHICRAHHLEMISRGQLLRERSWTNESVICDQCLPFGRLPEAIDYRHELGKVTRTQLNVAVVMFGGLSQAAEINCA